MSSEKIIQKIELWKSAGVDQILYQHTHNLCNLLPEKARKSFCTLILMLYAKRSSGQVHLDFKVNLLIKELQSYCLSYLQNQKVEVTDQKLVSETFATEEIIPIFESCEQGLFQDMIDLKVIGKANKPFVLHEEKFYLQRDFRNQQIVLESIKNLTAYKINQDWQSLSKAWYDILENHPVCNRSKQAIKFVNEQKQALAQTLLMPVSIISGGPGTGKTSIVVNLLRLLQHLNQLGKFALVAPTGKAGKRLFESIQQGLDSIGNPTSDDKSLQSELHPANTLHRLLGYSFKNATFSRDQYNPLRFDTLIIDEVSMIDLEMMSKLLNACQQGTRLILLGDVDQLPPIGAGRPLVQLLGYAGCLEKSDVMRFRYLDKDIFSGLESFQTAQIQGLGVQKLKESHRQKGEIYELAKLWNQKELNNQSDDSKKYRSNDEKYLKDVKKLDKLNDHQWQGVSLYECNLHYKELLQFTKFWSQKFLRLGYNGTKSLDTLFEQQSASQVMTLHRQGTWGVEGLNAQFAKSYLKGQSLDGARVIMNKNDYLHGVYNGEQGCCVQEKGELYFAFAGGQSPLLIKEQELSGWEFAYAITVHKSQGSEYDHIAIILPDQMSPVFTKSALYTALTRAKKICPFSGI